MIWRRFWQDLLFHFARGGRACRKPMSLVVREYAWEAIGWVSIEQPADNDNGRGRAA